MGLVLALNLTLLSSPAEALPLPKPISAGPTAGANPELQVGAWSHRVPLELPPAPAGMVPTVALVADHRVNDGPVGTGWRLDGLSRIERRGPTGGVPSFTTADIFYLDGERLWAVSATLTAAYFRLERDDNRVFAYSTADNTWTVRRDGWTWTYGESSGTDWGDCATEYASETWSDPCEGAGTDASSSDSTAWLLARAVDPHGNEIAYTYEVPDEAEPTTPDLDDAHGYLHLPSTIAYAGGTFEVRFTWQDRPDRRVDGRSGLLRTVPVRLSEIALFTGILQDRYTLTWLDEATEACPGVEDPLPDAAELLEEVGSLVQRIQRTGPIGGGKLLRCNTYATEGTGAEDWPEATEFTFEGASASDVQQRWDTWSTDFDGNGRPEMVVNGAYRTSGAYPTSVITPYVWEYVDGDWEERADIAALFEAALVDWAEDWVVSPTDIDRDGRTDLLVVTTVESSTGCPTCSSGGRVWSLERDGTVTDTESLGLDPEEEYAGWACLAHGQVADVNGDGFADLIVDETGMGDDECSAAVDLYEPFWIPNTGGGVNPFWDLSGAVPFLDHPMLDPADAAADLAVMVAACEETSPDYEAYLASGWELHSTDALVRASSRYTDLNGDGVADLAVSLYPCWYDHEVERSSGPSDWQRLPDEETVFSRIFYGDGAGSFVESGLGAGSPVVQPRQIDWAEEAGGDMTEDARAAWLESMGLTDTYLTLGLWSVADLDRSGHNDLLDWAPPESESPGRLVGRYADAGLADGFGWPADTATASREAVPFSYALSDTVPAATTVLVADWDADGFTDLLRVRRPWLYVDDDVDLVTLDLAVELSLNPRSIPRGRLTSIRTAWGGSIEPTFAFTDVAGNPDLRAPMEVVSSVADEDGTRTYDFEGGYWWDAENRFIGFQDALVTHESGRQVHTRFARANWWNGDWVFQSEQRSDGTIERFRYRHPFYDVDTSLAYDNAPPYWNPTRRECAFEVGPGAPGQSVTEVDLIEQCVEADDGPTFGQGAWYATLGWMLPDSGSAGPDDELAAAAWAFPGLAEETFESTGTPFTGTWHAAPTLSAPGYPPLVGTLPSELDAPSTPSRSMPIGPTSTEVVGYLTLWEYDADQRIVSEDARRDMSTTADDIRTVYTYGAWDTASEGKPVEAIERRVGSTTVDELAFSDFAAFNTPETVTEPGSPSRTWTYTYDAGELTSSTDPDLAVTSWTRNACGLPETMTDPVGRVESRTYDGACRLTGRSWQGSTTTWTRDALGRVDTVSTTVDSGGSDAITETWYRDDAIASPDNSATWDEPRAAVLRGTALELLYLDPWGRETRVVACENAGGASGSGVLASVSCAAETEVVRYTGYAADGSVRVASDPFYPGATGTVPGVWRYLDEAGRPESVYAPSPEVGRFVSTSFDYAPGTVKSTDPVGMTCTTSSSTLERSTTCEGEPRGATYVDAQGRVDAVELPDGTTWRTEYDAFDRPSRRYLDAVVEVDTGYDTVEWAYTWTPAGRPYTETDALGTVTTYAFDAAGRPESVDVDPTSGPAIRVAEWDYTDHSGANTRMVGTKDKNGAVTFTWLDGLDRPWKVLYPDMTSRETSWDGRGLVEDTVNEDGVASSFTYDAAGRMIAVTDPVTLAEDSYGHDAAGRVLGHIDRDGILTETTYTWSGLPSATTRGAYTLSAAAYRDDGRPEDLLRGGVATHYDYDALGRRSRACIGAVSPTDCAVELEYGWTDNDQLDTVWRNGDLGTVRGYSPAGWLTSLTHPDSTVESYTYDVLGHLRRSEDADGVVSEWEYDALGRVTWDKLPGRQPASYTYTEETSTGRERREETAPDLEVWRTWTDFRGREVEFERPDGTGSASIYAGTHLLERQYLDSGSTPLAHEAWGYDGQGRLDWHWGPVAAGNYDGDPDPGDYVRYYDWSPAGRLESIEGPNDLTDYVWDASDGTLFQEVVTGVTTTTYAYDTDYPRLAALEVTDGSAAARTMTRTWYRGLWVEADLWEDPSGTELTTNFGDWDGFGTALNTSRYVDGVLQYAEARETDALGRITHQEVTMGGGFSGEVDRGYTPGGRVAEVDTDWAGGFFYVRSGADLDVSEVRKTGSTPTLLATVVSRDDYGRITELTTTGGTGQGRTYDALGRVATTWARKSATVTQTRTYTWDDRDRLQQMVVAEGATSRTDLYDYSEPGWLTYERTDYLGPTDVETTYGYDDAGNRTSSVRAGVPISYSYDYGNRLTAVGPGSLDWDAYGGVAEDQRGYVYDRYADGEEWGIDDASGAPLATIERDVQGRPTEITDTAGTTTQVWDNPGGMWPLAGENEAGAGVLWVALEGLLVGQQRGSTYRSAAVDAVGSLVLYGTQLKEPTGAWGNKATSPSAAPERYAYAGMRLLPGAQVQLAQHRVYDPKTGSFLSQDPIGLAGGPHRFQYANAEPTRWLDPEGYFGIDRLQEPIDRMENPSDATRLAAADTSHASGSPYVPAGHSPYGPTCDGMIAHCTDEGDGEGGDESDDAEDETTAEEEGEDEGILAWVDDYFFGRTPIGENRLTEEENDSGGKPFEKIAAWGRRVGENARANRDERHAERDKRGASEDRFRQEYTKEGLIVTGHRDEGWLASAKRFFAELLGGENVRREYVGLANVISTGDPAHAPDQGASIRGNGTLAGTAVVTAVTGPGGIVDGAAAKLALRGASRGGAAALSKLEGVPWGTYCASGCEDVAAKIQGAIGGEIKTLRPTLPRAQTLGPRAGVGDTRWATHDVVVKDGMVYDALTGPGGMATDAYKAQWGYADVIDFGF